MDLENIEVGLWCNRLALASIAEKNMNKRIYILW